MVMVRVSSRCTARVAQHVNRQTQAFSVSWNTFLMYKGPRQSIPKCANGGDGTAPLGEVPSFVLGMWS